MVILTLNCGSSSVKFQLYDWKRKSVLMRGAVERVGASGSFIELSAGGNELRTERECPTHTDAVALIVDNLADPRFEVISDVQEIAAVGHRVVHGGEKITESIVIDAAALQLLRTLVELAPLHLPSNIAGIEAVMDVLPGVPQCAALDTAWHQSIPPHAFLYALPYDWYEEFGIRRYGFHGTSFLYTARRAAAILGRSPNETRLIICHIGNGASICAVRDGVSTDTSMGFTPLEGLVMGSRCGDIDPAIPLYVMRRTGMGANEMDETLNRKSGLIGLTGDLIDRRDIAAEAAKGSARAQLSMEIEAYRIQKYIGAYSASLGRVDAVVFTAGVGEMQPFIRRKATDGLSRFGIELDHRKNELAQSRNIESDIARVDSEVRVFVIPTDEELVLTEDTAALLEGTYRTHTEFTYSFESSSYRNRERERRFESELRANPELANIRVLPHA